MCKETILLLAAVFAAVALRSDAFMIPQSSSTVVPSITTSPLFMGKSQVMPGPSGKASSGPSASEFRQKKMSDRLRKKNAKKNKKNKKAGGFGDEDGEGGSSAKNSKKSPIMEIELVAEPEGGVEVIMLEEFVSAEGGEEDGSFQIRLKDMGVIDASLDKAVYEHGQELGAEIHNFWLTASAEGSEISKIRTVLLKDAAKNANFPGFRKGQIPPYAQPKMTNFALRDAIVGGCEDALKKFGVLSLDAETTPEGLGEVTFHEDVDKISNKYNIKTCPTVPFTANFRGTFDPNLIKQEAATEEDDGIVEAEVVEE